MQDFNPANRTEQDFKLPSTRKSLIGKIFSILSTPTLTRGVDLSHWNGDVDFVAMKNSGIEFVILKATEGTSFTDERFAEYWQKAYDAGLLILTYHFFRSNYGGAPQATWHKDNIQEFLSVVGYKTPIVLADVETPDGATITQRQNRLLAFHQTIIGTGYQSGHYSSPYLWQTLIGSVPWADDYIGWVAHWTSANEPTLPQNWTTSSSKFWQYGIYPTHIWVEPVKGVSGAVDCNWFYGSVEDLKALLGVPEPPPADCCDELRAEIARLETEINVLKLEIYNSQQKDIAQDENILNLQLQGVDLNKRLSALEAVYQAIKNELCN